jgi:sulfite exporter TauE/SafE
MLQLDSTTSNLKLGLFNGLLPCGLVYMALLASISMGSILGGALYMFIFGLGTLPMLLAAAYFGKQFKSMKPALFGKAVPAFVAFIAILLIVRGLGLGIPYLSPAVVSDVEMTLCIAP